MQNKNGDQKGIFKAISLRIYKTLTVYKMLNNVIN